MIHQEQHTDHLHSAQPNRTGLLAYRVNVYADMPLVLHTGDMITMIGEVIGFETGEIDFQWQVYDDGAWWDVPGATESTHCFEATQESINRSWRLSVRERRVE